VIEPNEPDGLRTLRSMATLAGRRISSARTPDGLTTLAAFFVISDGGLDCWHWSRRDGLHQFTAEQMQQKQWIEGYSYYSDQVWNDIIIQRLEGERRRVQELVQRAMNSAFQAGPDNPLSLLQQGLARR